MAIKTFHRRFQGGNEIHKTQKDTSTEQKWRLSDNLIILAKCIILNDKGNFFFSLSFFDYFDTKSAPQSADISTLTPGTRHILPS